MTMIDRLASGDALFGEPLLPLGRGPIPVAGSSSGVLCLDSAGNAVLVAELDDPAPGSAVQIADHLDRLGRYSEAELEGLRTAPFDAADLSDSFESFFGKNAPKLNKRQRTVVVVGRPPSVEDWRALIVELGPQLAGVFLLDGERVESLEPPAELRRGSVSDIARIVIGSLIAVVIVESLLLIVSGSTEPAPPVPTASSVRTVVQNAPPGATNPQWIGQQHLVRDSTGRYIAVYPGGGDLQIVTDLRNGGRVWQLPTTAKGIDAGSVSVAIDRRDRLHIAYSDGQSIKYALLEERKGKWRTVGRILDLDEATESPVVDVAWDELSRVAHVVWARREGGSEEPRWAAIEVSKRPTVMQTASLAPAGDKSTVLVNVVADPGGGAVATYRKASRPIYGWFSRVASIRGKTGFEWQREQAVPTKGFIGAGDVAMDGAGTAHLVLRDSNEAQLLYFTKERGGRWSDGEVAVDAGSIEGVDFHGVSLDRTSGLVYVFFQSNESVPQTEIRATVRDPAVGWSPAFSVATTEQDPNGAAFPSTMRLGTGYPIVLWSTTMGAPAIQLGQVVAP